MRRLGIVPARGGSKRLPGKNMMLLDGKPLLSHTLDVVRPLCTTTILTSDSLDICDYYNNCNSDESFIVDLRPSQLATDNSKVIDTVYYYYDKFGRDYDQIWLFLPTCPLRDTEDVLSCIRALDNEQAIDGVLSITDYEFPPTLGMCLDEVGEVSDWHESSPWKNGNTRSQDHPRIYRPNGAVYGMWCHKFGTARSFYKGHVKGVFMERARSVDIDTMLDFKVAEALLC